VFLDKTGADKTGFTADKTTLEAETPIGMTLKYTLNEGVVNQISDASLRISISAVLDLDEDSIKLDGTSVTDYTVSGRELIVPVSKSSGELKFTVVPEQADSAAAFAQMSFTYRNAQRVETIGTIYLNATGTQEPGFQIDLLGINGYNASVVFRNYNAEERTVVIAAAVYDANGNVGTMRVYEDDGRLVEKKCLNIRKVEIPAGGSETLFVNCDPNMVSIKAFILDPVTMSPKIPCMCEGLS
jgi:FtsP/CotA-like multicopper oxidase with cupredoxin domain